MTWDTQGGGGRIADIAVIAEIGKPEMQAHAKMG